MPAEFDPRVSLFLLRELEKVALGWQSAIPFLSLELCLLDIIFRAQDKHGGGKVTSVEKKSQKVKVSPTPERLTPEKVNSPIALPTDSISNSEPLLSDSLTSVHKGDGAQLLSAWQEFVQAVEKKQAAVAMLLKSSRPLEAGNGSLQVAVFYPFHKERLDDQQNRSILHECLQPFAGGEIDLQFILAERETPPVQTETVTNATEKTENLSELAEDVLL